MQGVVGTDRRILRAFYTQYVALLLIVLTFTIGAFQRASDKLGAAEPAVTQQTPVSPASIGGVTIPKVFTADGSVVSGDERLEAVVKVLEEHDLRALVTLSVPRLDFDEQASSLRRTLRRLQALEEFFRERAIPQGAVRFTAKAFAGTSEELSIRFYSDKVV
jgi:hypothetical protein